MEDHIYILNTELLRDPALYACWYGRVPEERRKKADAFRSESDRRLSLGAGIVLAEGLSRAGVPEADAARGIVRDENGKPHLAGGRSVHFNLSHSGTMAVCAVSGSPVGVDIERERHFSRRLSEYVFRPEEIRYVHERYGSSADAGFTELWTVKESVMKYFGAGIRMAPRTIGVDLREPVRAACEGFACEGLRFTRYEIAGGYQITVCSLSGTFPQEPEWVDLDAQ